MIKPKTLKGFRDFLPIEARKRQYVIDILKQVFESYGFEPLETPTLEYEDVLIGKYGDEGDKLMYRFVDRGGRKVALRYDQTVPLARVVAQYGSTSSPQVLPMPFKRYQIQNVWRAENTQKGRYREFLQCDADIVGPLRESVSEASVSSSLADAEVIMVAAKAIEKLGFKDFKILINDRAVFSQLSKLDFVTDKNLPTIIRTLDKLKKIGKEGAIKELLSKGITEKDTITILQCAVVMQKTERIKRLFSLLEQFGLMRNKDFVFSPTLARGLDYYTGMIFEIEIDGYSVGSVCGGGRYDNLIGMFAGKQIPAVGFAFGFDRLIDAMDELNLFPQNIANSSTKVLVTIFSKELIKNSLDITTALSSAGVSTELYLDENASLDKQLKYADQKRIPYVIIIGPNEASKNAVTLRNLKTREQKIVSMKEIFSLLPV